MIYVPKLPDHSILLESIDEWKRCKCANAASQLIRLVIVKLIPRDKQRSTNSY